MLFVLKRGMKGILKCGTRCIVHLRSMYFTNSHQPEIMISSEETWSFMLVRAEPSEPHRIPYICSPHKTGCRRKIIRFYFFGVWDADKYVIVTKICTYIVILSSFFAYFIILIPTIYQSLSFLLISFSGSSGEHLKTALLPILQNLDCILYEFARLFLFFFGQKASPGCH